MLMYRQGITKQQLVIKVDWLRKEVLRRGGETNLFATNDRTAIVTRGIQLLSHVIVQRRSDIYEPAINSRTEYSNMLVLGHYRNKIVHLFFKEGIFACALYALTVKHLEAQQQQSQTGGNGNGNSNGGGNAVALSNVSTQSNAGSSGGHHIPIAKSALLTEARFLFNLLQREFIYCDQIPDRIDSNRVSEQVLGDMITHGIFKCIEADGEQYIEIASTGETHFSFLCALIWPFIDSYYAAAMVLFSLQPNKKMEETQLLQRTQWLATVRENKCKQFTDERLLFPSVFSCVLTCLLLLFCFVCLLCLLFVIRPYIMNPCYVSMRVVVWIPYVMHLMSIINGI